MEHDLIQLAKITANQLRGSAGHVLMRCAVEPIAPDPILLSKITRDRVRRGGRRQMAEEGGIEDRNMAYVELSSRGFDTRHGSRIVQRRKRNQVLDLLEHVVIDDGRIGE